MPDFDLDFALKPMSRVPCCPVCLRRMVFTGLDRNSETRVLEALFWCPEHDADVGRHTVPVKNVPEVTDEAGLDVSGGLEALDTECPMCASMEIDTVGMDVAKDEAGVVIHSHCAEQGCGFAWQELYRFKESGYA